MSRLPAACFALPLVLLVAAFALTACSSDDSSDSSPNLASVTTPLPTLLPSSPVTTDAAPTATPVPPPTATPIPPSPTPQPPAPTPTPIPIVIAPSPTPIPIFVPAPSPTSIPVPAPTASTGGGAATTAPSTGAPAPSSLISFNPPQIQQGTTSIAYFNNPSATSATLHFGGKTYPMLKNGQSWWAIVGVGALSNPGAAPVSVDYATAAGPQTSATGAVNIVHRDYETEDVELDDTTSQLLAPDIVNAEEVKRTQIYSGYTMQRLWSGPFVRPNAAAVGDVYGILRSYNHAPPTSYHTGTDFVAFDGTPALAAAAGKVVFAGQLQVRGNSVIVDHGMGVFTAYHHLSRIDVQQGQAVSPGMQVGLTGHTGLVTGPHLHWEVIVRGIEVDGLLWLKGTEIGP